MSDTLGKTPIYIRGKRWRTTESKEHFEQKRAKRRLYYPRRHHYSEQIPQSPMTPSRGVSVSSSHVRHNLEDEEGWSQNSLRHQSRNRARRKGKLSPIESLPAELLEKIFLMCLDCNFPLASPHIAAVLSSESIFRLLTLLAFWDHACDVRKIGNIERVFEDVDHNAIPSPYELQSAILKFRWFSIHRLQTLRLEVFDMCISHGCFNKDFNFHNGELERMKSFIGKNKSTYLPMVTEKFRGRYGSPLSPQEIQALLDKNYPLHNELTVNIGPVIRLSVDHRGFPQKSFSFPMNPSVLPDIRIRGSPWTPGKIAFLDYVIDCLRFYLPEGARAQPLSPTVTEMWCALSLSEDARNDGITSALMEGNIDALRKVIEITYFDVENGSGPMMYSPEQFHTAIKYANGQTDILQCMIDSTTARLDPDPQLTEYALELKEQGHSLGEEILARMSTVQIP